MCYLISNLSKEQCLLSEIQLLIYKYEQANQCAIGVTISIPQPTVKGRTYSRDYAIKTYHLTDEGFQSESNYQGGTHYD